MARVKLDKDGRVLSIDIGFMDSFVFGERLEETDTGYIITDWLGRKKTYIKSLGLQVK